MNDSNDLNIQRKLSLIEEATNIAGEGIIITDAQKPGNPIIYVNDGFERLTGYSREFILGKNCRFLQGEKTDPQSIENIRQAIRDAREYTVELLNYNKDGTPFWNRLTITPLKNVDGVVTHYVGVQSDITELKNTKDKLEKVNKKLQKFHTEMTEELAQARKAQKFILPSQLPHIKNLHIATKFVPFTQIGGDFFDIVKVSEHLFGFLVADVTGHGIPASLLTFMSSNAFKNSYNGDPSSKSVLSKINETLYGSMPFGNFVTMFYLIYDSVTRTITYTQGGHPPALVIRPSTDEVLQLSTMGILVGIVPTERTQFKEKTTHLEAGDKVLLYTDAIIEAMDEKGNMMEISHLVAFLKKNMNTPIETLLEKIYDFGLSFSGKKRYHDDVTLVGLELVK